MSKKNEKRKRNLEREKAHRKESILPIVVGFLFLVLGFAGLMQNRNALKDYEHSADIRTVDALVTDVKEKEDQSGDKSWFAHLEFQVDGASYRETDTFYSHEIGVGDHVSIEVYRQSNGKYAIPHIYDSRSLKLQNTINVISMAAGAVILIAGLSLLFSSTKKVRELQSKIQPDRMS